MSTTQPTRFLRTVLLADAATCLATGWLLAFGADFVHGLTGIAAGLSFYAGTALLPIGAFIALVATRLLVAPAVWLVIAGNLGWVAGSVWLLAEGGGGANALGMVFIGAQALVVAVLAEMEFLGVRRMVGGGGLRVEGV
ncbi:hypothetical protein BKK81_08255 [Cupriavidus sp. USMAHM13]|uniref:hypothetical protein n=1 Tax=Cupriavidus sp. USMAHM13 TaxID=1389192 RepID=UPI0008A672EE|nr:hypothetical protein [Cupriavidus sp. USMAHM13]AOY99253.1 hypothetical protein BKK81_08255 [Cupriavidus sp. USMAHM13]